MSKQRRPVVCGNVNWGTTRASLIAFLVAASLFVGGGSGDLSGDFYYTTRGGDVKRLADREVALVKASDQFDAEWRKAVTGFQAALQVAYESKDTGSQALQDRVVKEWTAHALKRIAWGEVKIGTILPVRVSGPARVPATHSMSSSRLILSRAVTKARFVRQRRDKTRSRQRLIMDSIGQPSLTMTLPSRPCVGDRSGLLRVPCSDFFRLLTYPTSGVESIGCSSPLGQRLSRKTSTKPTWWPQRDPRELT